MKINYLFLIIFTLFLTACTTTPQDSAPNGNINATTIPNAKPKTESKSQYGNPSSYEVFGRHYHVLNSSKDYHATGIASWYGMKFNGQFTSNREKYNVYKMTAAHKTLPIPSYVKVTNLENGKHVIVRINDRGPFEKNRLIDLSYIAAKKLGIVANGTGLVRVDAINCGIKNNSIYLQVGAYHNLANAKQMQQRLKNISSPCHIFSNKTNNLHYVQIGPISNNSSAKHIIASLKSMGFPAPVMTFHTV
jgi:rare lipoprotein A